MSLEETIKETINNLLNNKFDKRVKSFDTYNSKYAILKNEVVVELCLKNKCIVAKIDVSDFFKEELE